MPAHNSSIRNEQRKLRERMRGLGMSHADIAAEIARQYRVRPRAAWRIAWGWTLEEAAERYNALRARNDAQPLMSLTGSRLSEWENWPLSGRKPPLLALCLLAGMYQAGVQDLIDFHDREKLPDTEVLALDKIGTSPGPGTGGTVPDARVPAPARQASPASTAGHDTAAASTQGSR
jgi:hypothetical protein